MGRRDYRKREPKKSKKGAKKTKAISEILPQVEVEVVKKKRKTSAEGVEEEA
ncbi:MAG: hypothetical protein U9R04_01155 [Chloroflexota bacterium]|nr:hypothetical protein [Chloroflexota bacterium]